MKQYTYEDVLPIIKDIVEVKGPQYVYEKVNDRCLYRDEEGNSSCLVGHFLDREALLNDLVPNDYEEEGVGSVLFTLTDNKIADFDVEASYFLTMVQEKQDSGVPWGQAVEFASTVITKERGC